MKILEAPKIKLDPDVKARWLDALRSGHYKQARGALAKDKIGDPCRVNNAASLCCIGVLGRIENIDGELTGDVLDGFTALEPEIAIENEYGESSTSGVGYVLAALNDEAKWNFNQIADWIEEYL